MATRSWRRCWLPSYLCQEVVSAARSTGIPCVLYPSNPLAPDQAPTLDARSGDVLLVVHHFGLACRPSWLDSLPPSVDLVEDHTHDPWSRWATTSRATYAFASLRKTLPIADGTPIWSPAGAPLPEPLQVTELRAHAGDLKRKGMQDKTRYLAGEDVAKDHFRANLLLGESHIASGEVSGICAESLASVESFPVGSWRAARRANAEHLRRLLGPLDGVQVLDWSSGATPFSVILLLPDRGRRDRLRGHLIENSIYPAVLWPLADAELVGITELDRSLADRMLSLHCDGRYARSDMDRVAEAVSGGLTP